MKSLLILGFALCAALQAFAAAAPGDATTIQGSWQPAAAVLGGQPLPAAVLQTIRLTLTAGKYEVLVGDQPDRGTYTLDATATPKALTVIGTAGPNAGKTFPAIYELAGDTLRICYDLSGTQRPTAFKSTADTPLYLVTYQRTKR